MTSRCTKNAKNRSKSVAYQIQKEHYGFSKHNFGKGEAESSILSRGTIFRGRLRRKCSSKKFATLLHDKRSMPWRRLPTLALRFSILTPLQASLWSLVMSEKNTRMPRSGRDVAASSPDEKIKEALSKKAQREAKLAEALRANLRKRKQ